MVEKFLARLVLVALIAAVLITVPYSAEPVSAQTAGGPVLANVAADGTATQSSTRFGGAAARAIDGNTSGVWRQGSVTHTNPSDGLPWWQVELSESVTIASISVWNRTNCCSDRLADFSVFVSDAPFDADATIGELQADPTVWSYDFDGAAGERVEIAVNARGGFVRIQKPAGTALSLAEVQVFADTSGTGRGDNIATEGTATQSSTRFGGAAARAVDGNTSGVWRQGSVTHTNPNDPLPWWQVDLGQQSTIDSVAIWNRTNCCSDRLADFSVFISDEPFPADATIGELQADPDVWSYSHPGTVDVNVDIPVVAAGRYVRIQKPAGTALSLAEVQVFEVAGGVVPRVEQDARLIGSSTADGLVQLSWDTPFDAVLPVTYEVRADGVAIGQTSTPVFETTITGVTVFDVVTTGSDGASFVSETVTLAAGTGGGDCVAVGLNDGTTAITWESAPEGFLTLLDNNDGVYTPLVHLDDAPVNGHRYYVDSITSQAGSASPDYRVVVMADDGTFRSRECVGSSFTPAQADRLLGIDFPVTPDGRIGRDMAGVNQTPVPVSISAPTSASGSVSGLSRSLNQGGGIAPNPDPSAAPSLCAAGGLYFDVVNTPEDEFQYVTLEVPAGVTVTADMWSTKAGGGSSGNWAFDVHVYEMNDDGTPGRRLDRIGASTPFYWMNPLFPDTFEERYYQFDDAVLFTAEESATYLIGMEVFVRVRINEFDQGAATILDNVQFVDEDRNPLTSPCALNELFKCQADGGNVYISADFSYQSTVELENGVPTDLAPGCYEYDHCGSSPFPAVIDQVATWACENEQLLNTAQDASVAVAFVAGMMLAAPVVGVGSGVVLAGAGLGGAMSLWSCDQSDNGFFRPSLDLDSSCVATEIGLGAVFAPLAGAAGGVLARRVAVACGWGGLEGATSTVAHMTFVEEDQAFDASDALIGAGIGCATGGVLEGSFGRLLRKTDDIEPPTNVGPTLGPGDAYRNHQGGGLTGLIADLEPDGTLNLTIVRGPNTPTGVEMFNEALDVFGDSVQRIRGDWNDIQGLSDNYHMYQAARASGLDEASAASATWTGQQAASRGFTVVESVVENFGEVSVIFTRP